MICLEFNCLFPLNTLISFLFFLHILCKEPVDPSRPTPPSFVFSGWSILECIDLICKRRLDPHRSGAPNSVSSPTTRFADAVSVVRDASKSPEAPGANKSHVFVDPSFSLEAITSSKTGHRY